jgi:hypothetical protein
MPRSIRCGRILLGRTKGGVTIIRSCTSVCVVVIAAARVGAYEAGLGKPNLQRTPIYVYDEGICRRPP